MTLNIFEALEIGTASVGTAQTADAQIASQPGLC